MGDGPEPLKRIRHYPSLTDYRSAYQYGLLDAVVGLIRSPSFRIVGSVLIQHYHEGYEEGDFLIFENEQE